MFRVLKERRRRQLREQPVPEEWRAIITRNLPFFARLSAADRKELLGHVQVLLAEKRFEGCARTGIDGRNPNHDRDSGGPAPLASQDGLLSAAAYDPGLSLEFLVDQPRPLEGQIWQEGKEGRLGETGRQMGSMVLAWDAAKSWRARSLGWKKPRAA